MLAGIIVRHERGTSPAAQHSPPSPRRLLKALAPRVGLRLFGRQSRVARAHVFGDGIGREPAEEILLRLRLVDLGVGRGGRIEHKIRGLQRWGDRCLERGREQLRPGEKILQSSSTWPTSSPSGRSNLESRGRTPGREASGPERRKDGRLDRAEAVAPRDECKEGSGREGSKFPKNKGARANPPALPVPLRSGYQRSLTTPMLIIKSRLPKEDVGQAESSSSVIYLRGREQKLCRRFAICFGLSSYHPGNAPGAATSQSLVRGVESVSSHTTRSSPQPSPTTMPGCKSRAPTIVPTLPCWAGQFAGPSGAAAEMAGTVPAGTGTAQGAAAPPFL